jgi:hypothetical protein
MEFSLPGLIGGVLGVIVGVINYGVLIGFLERALRATDKSQTAEERAAFENKLSLTRKLILGGDVVAFGIIGYMLGKLLAG